MILMDQILTGRHPDCFHLSATTGAHGIILLCELSGRLRGGVDEKCVSTRSVCGVDEKCVMSLRRTVRAFAQLFEVVIELITSLCRTTVRKVG